MAIRPDGETLRWLDALHAGGSFSRMDDGQLLGRFLGRDGPGGELAFEALVRRHGPMVLAACRGVLRDEDAADDAFQATFLVLARRASGIRDRDRLAPWLARAARRIALGSRAEAARRAGLERRIASEAPRAAPAHAEVVGLETSAMVRREVDRLPEPDRLLLDLTYWQGKTYEEVAARLSRPIGTVRSRLSRIRDRLRGDLARLGLAPGSMIAPRIEPAASPPESLVLRTARVAARHSGDWKAAVESGMVPASVASMAEGELAMMAPIPWKSTATLLILGGAVTAGAATLALRGPDAGPVPGEPAARPAPQSKAEVKSILANGGVEEASGEDPKSWSRGAKVAGVEYKWARDAGHEGKASLRLKKTANRYIPIAQWTQKVDRTGDAPRLKVWAWVKADKATKAILDAQFLDDKGEWQHAWAAYIGAKEADDPPATHDWKRYEGVVEIPAGTRQILIAPQIYGPGTVWFDDLGAEYTSDPATNPTGE